MFGNRKSQFFVENRIQIQTGRSKFTTTNSQTKKSWKYATNCEIKCEWEAKNINYAK